MFSANDGSWNVDLFENAGAWRHLTKERAATYAIAVKHAAELEGLVADGRITAEAESAGWLRKRIR